MGALVAITKTIICLANSKKLRERCVAGREFTAPRKWIRPVSALSDAMKGGPIRACWT
jgi:hypothetical protein